MDRLQQASKVDLHWYLTTNGYTPTRETSRSASFSSPFRSEGDPSFHIDRVKNRWADWGKEHTSEDPAYGDTIDFVRVLEGCTTAEAVDKMLGKDEIKQYHREDITEVGKKNIEVVAVAEEITNKALIEYSEGIRHVPLTVVNQYCNQVSFQFPASKYCTHIGIGLPNDVGGFALRNTWFRGSSDKAGISTVINNSSLKCLLFEGAWDWMSYYVLYGEPDGDVIVLNSLVYIPMITDVLLGYDDVECWLDNDPAANMKMEHMESHGIVLNDKRDIYGSFNDLNDFLAATYDI